MDFIKNLLDLNKITAKTAFLILIIASSLLFLPSHFLDKLQIIEFKKDFGKYFGFAFIAAAAFLFIALLNWFQLKVNSNISKRKMKKQLYQAVANLDYAEMAVLREFFIYNQQSLDMPIDNPVVAGMLKKGILTYVSSMGAGAFEGIMFPVSINVRLRDFIKPEILGFEFNPSEDTKIKILNARPDWAKSRESRLRNRLW